MLGRLERILRNGLIIASLSTIVSCSYPVIEYERVDIDFLKVVYKIEDIRVIDGDTIEANVKIWPNLILHDKFRLSRIDAPELTEKEKGERSKEYLSELLKEGEIRISVTKKDKYGRWLIEIYKDKENLNQKMLDNGFAKPYTK